MARIRGAAWVMRIPGDPGRLMGNFGNAVQTDCRLGNRYSMQRRSFIAGALAATAAILGRPPRAPAQGRWWSSLVFGLFENHAFSRVAGLPSHQRLAREGTVLAQYFAVAHPSGPNYRALVSGATWGRAQIVDTFHATIGSAAAALSPAIPTYIYHLVGTIARRHNPLVDLHAPVARVRFGMAALKDDLHGDLPAPALVYVGWDDGNNMHGGAPARADENLTALLDLLAASPWFTRPDPQGRYPAFFFCYDEGDTKDNHVFAAWWGRAVRAGAVSQTPHNHFGFCRTATENWGLPPLEGAAGERPITEPWSER
jgi:phosphatidylinositol-3-phosphatase